MLLSPITHFASFLSLSFRDNVPYAFFVEPGFYLMYMNESVEYSAALIANLHIPPAMTRHSAWPFLAKYHHTESLPTDNAIAQVFAAKIFDPYLAPMMANSLAGLPPALVLVSEYDLFRDDGLAYADRLNADGAETVVLRSHGFHGIYSFFDKSVSGGGMVRSVVDYLRGVYNDGGTQLLH